MKKSICQVTGVPKQVMPGHRKFLGEVSKLLLTSQERQGGVLLLKKLEEGECLTQSDVDWTDSLVDPKLFQVSNDSEGRLNEILQVGDELITKLREYYPTKANIY